MDAARVAELTELALAASNAALAASKPDPARVAQLRDALRDWLRATPAPAPDDEEGAAWAAMHAIVSEDDAETAAAMLAPAAATATEAMGAVVTAAALRTAAPPSSAAAALPPSASANETAPSGRAVGGAEAARVHSVLRRTAEVAALVRRATLQVRVPLPAYVINLTARDDKLACFQAQAAMLSFLRIVRVPAVVGAELSLQELRAAVSLRARATLQLKMAVTDLDSRGAVGCSLSHIASWRAIVAADEPAFVFEDDAALMPQEIAGFALGVARGAVPFDYVMLGSHANHRPTIVAPAVRCGDVDIAPLVPYPVGVVATGSHAYWCTPRVAAHFLHGALPLEMAIDAYMACALAEVVDGPALLKAVVNGGPVAASPGSVRTGWLYAASLATSSSDIPHPRLEVTDSPVATDAASAAALQQAHGQQLRARAHGIRQDHQRFAFEQVARPTLQPHWGLLPAVLDRLAQVRAPAASARESESSAPEANEPWAAPRPLPASPAS